MDETKPVDEAEEQPLSERHLQWKLRAAEELHRFANQQGWCGDFDEVLLKAGLSTRGEFLGDGKCDNPDCCAPLEDTAGEDTAEAFEAWKLAAVRTFYRAAKHYGIGSATGWEARLVELGFPIRTERAVRVEGTFSIPTTVQVFEGESLVDGLPRQRVRDLVQGALYQNEVPWKVVVASVDTDGHGESRVG